MRPHRRRRRWGWMGRDHIAWDTWNTWLKIGVPAPLAWPPNRPIYPDVPPYFPVLASTSEERVRTLRWLERRLELDLAEVREELLRLGESDLRSPHVQLGEHARRVVPG